MSVETVRIKPEIDPAALKKAEGQLAKAFSPTGRGIGALRKGMGGFYREAEKAAAAFGSEKKSPKEWAKALATAQKSQAEMRKQLSLAEATLGKQNRLVREMRMEYAATAVAAAKMARDERAAALERIKAAKAEERAGRRAALRGAVGAGAARVGGAVKSGAQTAVLGAVGLGLGAGALAMQQISEVRSRMDRAAKSANLSVREFGRLEHAATLSGTSIEVVEKSTQKLSSLLNKAPTKEFGAALQALGLEAKTLQGLSPEEQLIKIADAMQGVEDDALKTTIASRLFGEEMGAKLVPMLQGGGAALKGMGDEAENLGRVFDADAAAAAERFGDAQDKIKRAIGGVSAQIIQDYMPALADATEGAVAWIVENKAQIEEWIRGVVDGLLEAAQAAGEWVASVDWGAVWEQITEVGSAVMDLVGFLMDLVSGLEGSEIAFGALALAATSALGPLGLVAVAGAGIGSAIAKSVLRARDQIKGVSVDLGRIAKQARDIQAIAGIKAEYAEEEAKDKAAAEEAGKAAEAQAKGERIAGRATSAAEKIYGPGKVPRGVQEQIDRMQAIASDPNSSTEARASVKEGLDALEKQAREKRNKGIRKTLGGSGGAGGAGGGKGGKPEHSAAGAQIESDIKALAERAGSREYQRVLQAGGTAAEADAAAKRVEKEATKQLQAQAGDLARRGFIGQSGGPQMLGGPGTTAAGAVPLQIDLGGRGGPAPIQIIEILKGGNIEIDIETQATNAQEIAAEIREPVRREVRAMISEALPTVDVGVRR